MLPLIFGSKGYHWFERLVVATLGIMVAVSIVLTLVQAGVALWQAVAADNHLIDHEAFIKVFGAFMTVLIAIEFNHTVLPDMTTKSSVVKVRAVLLVAMLALARKVILLDFKEIEYTMIIGLAVLFVGIAAAYWGVRREEECSLFGRGGGESV
jgi:uncharacterized membrane protein (DUF373 family)